MGTPATYTTALPTMKEIWADGLESALYKDNPAFALCPKSEDWDGSIFHCVIDVGGMNGVSSTFARAKANQSPSQPLAFNITTADRFGTWSIEHKLTVLQRNSRGRIVEAMAYESKKLMDRLAASYGAIIHGDGGGSIGRISVIAGPTATLLNPDDVKNLEVGDLIYLSGNSGAASTDALRAGGPLTVQSVDFDAGSVTFTAGIVATIGTAVVNDYIFRDGDFQLAPTGFEGWNPLVIPATAFFGMTRTTYGIRQAGLRKDVSATVLWADKIRDLLTYASRATCDISHLFLHPTNWSSLEKELQTAKRYTEEAIAGVGFEGIKFSQQNGKSIMIHSDPYAPLNVARGVNYTDGTFGYKSAGPLIQALTLDGKKDMMMDNSLNQFEGRLGGYGNFWCKKPLNLLRGKLA